MDSRTFERVTIALPALDDPGLYLSNVTTLEPSRGPVQDFRYSDAHLRELDLADTQLLTGRITHVTADRVRLHQMRLDSVEFDGCDLRSLQWSESKLSRVVFRNCKLMGAALHEISLDNVLFENCKIDYATLDQVRATGPLAFATCTFTEAALTRCDLSRARFEACALHLTEFSGGNFRESDLRGNDLSTIRGVSALRRVIINRPQQTELAHALAAELDITFGDTLDDLTAKSTSTRA